MLSLIRRYKVTNTIGALKITKLSSSTSTDDDIEFRVLQLIPPEKKIVSKKQQTVTEETILTKLRKKTRNRDWHSIWPVARSFHPDIVPLPLQQGYKNNEGVHPGKYGNAELLKIPNFLHLTPPTVEKHCKVLKKFCTKWPKELESDEEACVKHFPVEVITSDYCYSSPTIREPLARIVSLRVKLSSLHLDVHAKDKILRLLGDRYNPETGVITIIADRCPTRKQNLDYAKYLLTALFHVSWRFEPWEMDKCAVDMEYYDWDKSKSRESLTSVYSWPSTPTDSSYEYIPHATEYKIAVSDLINKGEDLVSLNKYKQAVKSVLNLKFNETME